MTNPNIPITGAFADHIGEIPTHPNIRKILIEKASGVFLKAAGIELPVAEETPDQQD